MDRFSFWSRRPTFLRGAKHWVRKSESLVHRSIWFTWMDLSDHTWANLWDITGDLQRGFTWSHRHVVKQIWVLMMVFAQIWPPLRKLNNFSLAKQGQKHDALLIKLSNPRYADTVLQDRKLHYMKEKGNENWFLNDHKPSSWPMILHLVSHKTGWTVVKSFELPSHVETINKLSMGLLWYEKLHLHEFMIWLHLTLLCRMLKVRLRMCVRTKHCYGGLR